MTRLEKERRRRIRIAVAALAYEEYEQPVMDDDEFDRLASEIMPLFRTGRHDDFFATEFSPDTGMWVHRHPDKAGLRRILREVHGFRAPDKPEDLI